MAKKTRAPAVLKNSKQEATFRNLRKTRRDEASLQDQVNELRAWISHLEDRLDGTA